MRVTKVMLEDRIKYLEKHIEVRAYDMKHLEEKVALLNSPSTLAGQITVLMITIQRLSEALAHVIADLKKKP